MAFGSMALPRIVGCASRSAMLMFSERVKFCRHERSVTLRQLYSACRTRSVSRAWVCLVDEFHDALRRAAPPRVVWNALKMFVRGHVRRREAPAHAQRYICFRLRASGPKTRARTDRKQGQHHPAEESVHPRLAWREPAFRELGNALLLTLVCLATGDSVWFGA